MSLLTANNQEETQKCRISCDYEILRNSPVFRSTNSDLVKLFAYLSKRKRFSPGDEIISHGKEAGDAFLLIEGEVEIITDHHGREIVVQSLGKDAFFGELSLLAKFPWFFTARAKTDCDILTISRESFEKALEQYPEKRQNITERIIQFRIERLKKQTSYMLDLIPPDQLKESIPKSRLLI